MKAFLRKEEGFFYFIAKNEDSKIRRHVGRFSK